MIKKLNATKGLTINENFMITAGPGAGKTHFLANHIEKILTNSSKVSELRKVLAITYTNIAANNLARRIKNTSDSIYVSTIHSFLADCVLFPYAWTLDGKYSLSTDIRIDPYQSVSFPDFQKLCKKYKYNWLLNDKTRIKIGRKIFFEKDGDNYKLSILPKDEGIYKTKNRIKNDSDFFMEYKQICWKNGIINYEDVLFLSLLILRKNPFIAKIISKCFPFIFVDEFQDTSEIQADIIKIFAHYGSIVGIIGDKNQSIYGFAHSSRKTFENFSLPNLNNYFIGENHRSSDQIVMLLNSITAADSQQDLPKVSGPKPLILVGDTREAISYFLKTHSKNKEETKLVLSYSNECVEQFKPSSGLIPPSNVKERIKDMVFDKRGKFIFRIIKAMKITFDGQVDVGIDKFFQAYVGTNATQNYIMSRFVSIYQSFSECINEDVGSWFNRNVLDKNIKKANSTSISKCMVKITKRSKLFLGMKIGHLLSEMVLEGADSTFRTIHQSKGDEADAVLIVIGDHSTKKEKLLSFMLEPNLASTNETDRVYYVAMSRAKKELFLSIPSLDIATRKKVDSIGLVNIKDLT
ncbi:MAG: ATP-dependent helicase [Lentilactobacillus diolivorans]|jgi:DNA helicase-2/ATP-dependent DNA helicase PcrA|nr:ATP-dependent helicase [Lentilactobacillus diolivorans]RRG01313.1 MAG: ATP-dependent helicase [Lactobacillus sp.]